jgi:transcriptional antiterminator NusG
MGVEEGRVEVDFEVGDSVTVKEGPFANFGGTIKELDTDKSKVRVLVNMFGRDTPVELDFNQVEKL